MNKKNKGARRFTREQWKGKLRLLLFNKIKYWHTIKF